MSTKSKSQWPEAVPSEAEVHQAKRRAVLREAAKSFNRVGFHGTTLDTVAKALGVSKAALYYYFPTKSALLKACVEEVMAGAMSNLEHARSHGGNGREKVKMVFTGYLHHLIDELTVTVVVMEDSALSVEDRDAAHAVRDRFEHSLRELVVEGIEDGSIVVCDPKLVVMAMLGAVNSVPRWYRPGGDWTAVQIAAAISELLERAINPAPPAALTARVQDVVIPEAES